MVMEKARSGVWRVRVSRLKRGAKCEARGVSCGRRKKLSYDVMCGWR
jgi:hypothetical protein